MWHSPCAVLNWRGVAPDAVRVAGMVGDLTCGRAGIGPKQAPLAGLDVMCPSVRPLSRWPGQPAGDTGAENYFAGVIAALGREGQRPDREACDDPFFAGLSAIDSHGAPSSPAAGGGHELWVPGSGSLQARSLWPRPTPAPD